MTEQLSLLDRAERCRKRYQPRSFHVRSHMTCAEVAAGEVRAKGQELEILDWFSHNEGRHTPSEVWNWMGQRWPLTSVRRALSDLTRGGWLRHYPADRRPGPYGSKESCWGLA